MGLLGFIHKDSFVVDHTFDLVGFFRFWSRLLGMSICFLACHGERFWITGYVEWVNCFCRFKGLESSPIGSSLRFFTLSWKKVGVLIDSSKKGAVRWCGMFNWLQYTFQNSLFVPKEVFLEAIATLE